MADPTGRIDVAKVMGGWRPTQQPGEEPNRIADHPVMRLLAEEYGGINQPEIMCSMLELGRLIHEYDGRDVPLEVVRYIVERNRGSFLAQRREERERVAKPSVVYYMRLGNRVKIGVTTNLEVRRATINPEEVMVTEPGDQKLEIKRHRQFADLRVVGEWFRLEDPLTSHIEMLRNHTVRMRPVDDKP